MTNFSPVTQLGFLNKSFKKEVCDYMKRVSAGLNISPVKRTEKPHVITFRFQPRLKCELGHVHYFSCAQKKHVKRFPANFPANLKHCARAEILACNRNKISAQLGGLKFQPRLKFATLSAP